MITSIFINKCLKTIIQPSYEQKPIFFNLSTSQMNFKTNLTQNKQNRSLSHSILLGLWNQKLHANISFKSVILKRTHRIRNSQKINTTNKFKYNYQRI